MAAAHESLDFGKRGHGCVAGGCHGESAVGDAAVERPGDALVLQQAVDEAGGEGVAAADAVEDVQIVEVKAFVGGADGVGKGAPCVAVGGVGTADGGGDHMEVGEVGGDSLGHGAEGVERVPGGGVGRSTEG